jgi:hypothetical protein
MLSAGAEQDGSEGGVGAGVEPPPPSTHPSWLLAHGGRLDNVDRAPREPHDASTQRQDGQMMEPHGLPLLNLLGLPGVSFALPRGPYQSPLHSLFARRPPWGPLVPGCFFMG